MSVKKKFSIFCGSTFAVIAIVLTLVLVLTSLNSINHDEYGIEYNTMTKKVNGEKILTEGRYVLTPTSHVFKYKRTLQTLTFSDSKDNEIECLTLEGLEMKLDVTIQYQIIKEQLFKIFAEYGEEEHYKPYLISVTRDTIKDVCSNFTGQNFFFNRSDIEYAIENTLKKNYKEYNVYSTFNFAQLRNVKHPSKYEKANQEKQSTLQEKNKVIRERQEKMTKEQTKLLSAIYDADIKLIQANATANSIILAANELAPSTFKKWKDRTDAFITIKSQLTNSTNANFINHYIRYYVMKDQKSVVISA